MRLQEEVHEQALDRRRIVADLVIPPGAARGGVLKSVQSRLAGERRPPAAPGRELAGEHRQHGIVPDLIMIDEVLIAERDPEDALGHERRHRVRDALAIAAIAEAGRKAPDEIDGPIGRAEQQRAGIGGDRSTVERGHHGPSVHRCKEERFRVTLRSHRGSPLSSSKSLRHNNFG